MGASHDELFLGFSGPLNQRLTRDGRHGSRRLASRKASGIHSERRASRAKSSHHSRCAAICFRLPLVPLLLCGMSCRCQTWRSSLFLPMYVSCKREIPMQAQYRSGPPQPQAWRLQRCVSLSAWAVRAGAVVRAARSERRFRWLDDEYRPRLKAAWLRLGGRWIAQDRCDAPELHNLCHSQFSRRHQRAWRSAAAPGLSLPVVCFPPENCLRTRHH